jgi:probable HAF family extracellular repeat protein
MLKQISRRIDLRRIFILVLLLSVVACASAQYLLTDLGSMGGQWSEAFAVNNVGHVSGHAATSTNAERAFAWDGAMHDLGTLENGGTRAYALNDSGQLAGSSDISVGFHAFFYTSGAMADLGTLGGSNSVAHGISNAGWVVGNAQLASGHSHGFLWNGTNMTDLGTLGGSDSGASDINNLGQVSGGATNARGGSRPFFWSSSSGMVDLGLLGTYTSGGARAINDHGVVVGSCDDEVIRAQAFWWDGTIHPLPILPIDPPEDPGQAAEAWGVNNHDQIVGYSEYGRFGAHAVLWDTDGHISDLHQYLVGWQGSYATGINDSGQIVGMGTNPQGRLRGFLLTPVPEPATILGLVGSIGWFWLRKQR